jgi:hypothetical protein
MQPTSAAGERVTTPEGKVLHGLQKKTYRMMNPSTEKISTTEVLVLDVRPKKLFCQ